MQKLNAKQQERLKALIKEYPAVAHSGLSAMSNVLGALKEVSEILAGARK
jgi:hypothetical protein